MHSRLAKLVTHLTADRGFPLTAMVRARFQLLQTLTKEIRRLRQLASSRVRGQTGQ